MMVLQYSRRYIIQNSKAMPTPPPQAALPHLREGAAIINSTSVTAYKGMAPLIDYSTTKGGIVSFTRALAQQLATKGGHVCVCVRVRVRVCVGVGGVQTHAHTLKSAACAPFPHTTAAPHSRSIVHC